MLMVFVVIILAIAGAIFGSFAGAQVWRLRAHQLADDKRDGDEIDEVEYKRLRPLITKISSDRSRCLSCGQTLRWYDLVPIISWMSTNGKCRYCKKSIGSFEILMELSFALFFILSYFAFLPQLSTIFGMATLAVWLLAGVIMGVLFAYDAKWYLLPEKMNILLALIATAFVVLVFAQAGFSLDSLFSLAGSLMIMSGIYLLIYIVSKGEWIGFGDVILGVGLGLLLVKWENAFLALFLANFLGLIAVAPAYLRKKVTGKTHIPFGPFLIIATVIVVLYGDGIMRFASFLLEGVANALLYAVML